MCVVWVQVELSLMSSMKQYGDDSVLLVTLCVLYRLIK